MKKHFVIYAILMIAVVSLFAQAPQKFSYQAVLRDAGGNLVTNQNVSVRISIVQENEYGASVYVETHSVTTNANGLVTIEVGAGNPILGSFADIDWSYGSYYLKSEVDPAGGNNYSITGVQQLLSVPYALYAGNTTGGFSGDYNDLINTPDIPTVPTNVSAFTNDAQYITQAALGSTLQGYATVGSIPTVPTNVSAFTNDAQYITQSALGSTLQGYATVGSIPTVPTNISAFTNDVGYITSVDVQEAANIPTNVSAFANDAGYVTASQLPTVPTNVSSFTNDAGYITAAQIPAQVPSDWNATTGPARILNKPAIPTVPTNVGAFVNDRGYITAANIPSNVSAFTNDAGYITTAEVQQAANIPTNVSAFNNDAGYITQPVLNVTLSNYATLNSLPTIPVNVSSFYNDAGYITTADVQQAANIPTNVSAFNNDAGYITAAAIPTNLSAFNNNVGYITAAQIPAQVPADWNAATGPARILNKPVIPTVPTQVSAFVNDAGYITTAAVPTVPAVLSAFNNDIGYITAAQVPAQVPADWNATTGPSRILNKPIIPTVPTNISVFNNDQGYITAANIPSNISAFNNDRGYITASSIPTNVSAFVNDRAYVTAAEIPAQVNADWNATTGAARILNKPTIPTVPTNLSAFTNDQGFITMASVPTNISAFVNDRGYITSSGVPTNVAAFENDAHYITEAQFNTILSALNNALDSLRGRIAELEAAPPTSGSVTISPVSNITEHTAVCGGEVLTDGGMPIIERGICWSTSHNPTISNSRTMDGAGVGAFTSTISGLTAGATYYVRAYAVNSVGTAYSGEISFTTVIDACQGVTTVTDIDGNVYNTLSIGNQCWMKENLRTTKYADGTAIASGSSTSTTVAYYYSLSGNFNNGKLYNWKAVMRNSSSSAANPSGVQGICPNGWHVPSDAEWNQLTDYVSSQSQYYCSNNPENIAKALASTSNWNSSSATCAVGNTPSNNNATGFSALPAGYYRNDGYSVSGDYAYFWSATESSSSNAYSRYLRYSNATVNRYGTNEYYGSSVRCVRD